MFNFSNGVTDTVSASVSVETGSPLPAERTEVATSAPWCRWPIDRSLPRSRRCRSYRRDPYCVWRERFAKLVGKDIGKSDGAIPPKIFNPPSRDVRRQYYLAQTNLVTTQVNSVVEGRQLYHVINYNSNTDFSCLFLGRHYPNFDLNRPNMVTAQVTSALSFWQAGTALTHIGEIGSNDKISAKTVEIMAVSVT